MQLGIMQISLDPGDLERSFQLAAEAGADGLEITCDSRQQVRSLLGKSGTERVRELKKTHEIQVPSIALGILRGDKSLFGDEEVSSAAKGVIHRALKTARELGAAVVLVPFLEKAMIELEEELDRVIEGLDELAEEAEEIGVTIGIESTLNVNQQSYLLEHLGAYTSLKVYYDTGNARSRRFDPATFLRDLGREKVCQMHFKDVRLGEEGSPPDFNVALGEGDVDFPAVAQAIGAIGYEGWIILETPATDDPLGAAKSNFKFARDLLG